ncbi:MAG: hypothetical protein K2Y23_01040 [Cyanobacteria bacterium]|nr:hypothetical protein [Cyanobacteriota bacterium]
MIRLVVLVLFAQATASAQVTATRAGGLLDPEGARILTNQIILVASGFTIVRDMGNNALYADTALRQAIEQGWIPGPTIINPGIIIGGLGGQFFPKAHGAERHLPRRH